MCAIMLYFCIRFKFDVKIAFALMVLQGIPLIWFGERLSNSRRKLSYPYFFFGIYTIIIMVVATYLIGQATYTLEESYCYWLTHLDKQSEVSQDLQISTVMIGYYIVGVLGYSKRIWMTARKDISRWLPNLWCLMLGVCFMLYSREGYNHTVRINTLFIGGTILAIYLVYASFISKGQYTTYQIKPKVYLILGTIWLLGIWVIGICIPEYQELPGTRWLRSIASSFGAKPDLHQKVPYERRLNSDIPLSNAILFEVKATESLYLREVAYGEYEGGCWYISEQEKQYDSYIDFKPQYLEAEYKQTDALLDEISFQNAQMAELLPLYAKMANYESNIIRKKAYTVIQNPINKINYFTVNNFFDIQDEEVSNIYYYQDLNKYYFHSNTLAEPSYYTVSYYDRLPKAGSREYVFLHNINGAIWEDIYNELSENKSQYELESSQIPKILRTYTPMIQYKNAKESFLQIPDELAEVLEKLTSQITMTQTSDWGKAELICKFLKENYTYHLKNKKIEGDRVYNFLFEEKEGKCQDFATSMTLMCRSIGLPAKYVTGYLVTEKNKESGNYIVREKDAHAFVEVYIAGYGWMSFDPTPERETEEIREEVTAGISLRDYIRLIVLGGMVCLILLLYRGGLTYVEEKWWLLIFKLTKREKQLDKLILREIKWLEKAGLERYPYETLTQYGRRLEEMQIDMGFIIALYERQKYGQIRASEEELQTAYKDYKSLKIKLKRLK